VCHDPFMDATEPKFAVGPDSYAQLIDDIQDFAIFILDAEGHIKTWNAGAEGVFGFMEE
jgi:PAS domain-containing protein